MTYLGQYIHACTRRKPSTDACFELVTTTKWQEGSGTDTTVTDDLSYKRLLLPCQTMQWHRSRWQANTVTGCHTHVTIGSWLQTLCVLRCIASDALLNC
jgi:hypothetical protein